MWIGSIIAKFSDRNRNLILNKKKYDVNFEKVAEPDFDSNKPDLPFV